MNCVRSVPFQSRKCSRQHFTNTVVVYYYSTLEGGMRKITAKIFNGLQPTIWNGVRKITRGGTYSPQHVCYGMSAPLAYASRFWYERAYTKITGMSAPVPIPLVQARSYQNLTPPAAPARYWYQRASVRVVIAILIGFRLQLEWL